MYCFGDLVNYLSLGFIVLGLLHVVFHRKAQASYGRHMRFSPTVRTVPAKVAWFLQEMPAFLIPLLLLLISGKPFSMGTYLLLGTFCIHYFQRIFVFSLLTRGRPFPLHVMLAAGLFCCVNAFLHGHYLLHCAHFDDEWSADYRFKTGLLLFYVGMAINIHSDYILRNLRKPGEIIYKIPTGGLFEYVSGANYLGEIVEWCGYAMATWSFPAMSLAVFSLCFIGPRAYYHHRFYQEKFKEYPKSRKALIPFIF
ncbi:3-oxo-5-alpha-steroid 4-dehydrogenase 2b [Mastacembelus armatus]|uniref:3-oxo-5-alpha-steroid 4-dehydrogenase n=1 Tax=Mastacembelus armatus TaxID=205130 RepID=A0A7N8XBU6_9TELE|nr:3-oxo-5-alpha-steroid 4-dehydrogenase 2 [Mastacembelus armatus]